MKKNRYIPDLTLIMAECEANYARMMKLVPEMSEGSERKIGVCLKTQNVELSFEVVECFKYTATVRLSMGSSEDRWLQGFTFLVRIYHDAQMAEVIEGSSRRQLQGRYRYPNQRMYHSDEKEQSNLHLGEWLRHCLLHGYELESHHFADVS